MSQFEFLENVTIGQYLPTDSAIHRLDPRAKLIMAASALMALIICRNLFSLLIALGVLLAGFVLARVPLSYALRGIKPALPVFLLLAVLQIVAIPANDTGRVLARWWVVSITTNDFLAATVAVIRLATLMLLIGLFTIVTSTRELTHGTERLFRPLQRIGFPAHELALIADLTLRFIPILAQEAEHIVKAQASRGAAFGKRPKIGPVGRIRALLPVLVPLFTAALNRSETLILAMTARGYTGGRGRTHLIRFVARKVDFVAVSVTLAFNTALVLSNTRQT